MSKKDRNIYLIDGNSICYRAYYAIQELSTSKGMPTNAIYGFVNILRKLIREHEPARLAVVFDTAAPTGRHKKYEEYKVHRKPMPDDLFDQIPRIKDIITAYGIPICQLDGYEADDIIATLAERAKKKGFDVTIVTSDKDAMQLVDDKVKVLSPHTAGDKIYDAREVKGKYGVGPELMVELMALMGDASDNIPGVKGIGQVTADKLINRYGGIREVYKNIDKISSESVRKKLAEGKEMAELSRELVELDRKVPVELDLDQTRFDEPDLDRLAELYREFEFEKFLREVMPKEKAAGKYSVADGEDHLAKAKEKIAKQKEVSLSMVASPGGKKINGIAFSWEEGQACFVSLEEEKSRLQAQPLIKEVLEDARIKKIGYDIKRDLSLLRRLCGIEMKGTGFDVMIADYLIDPSRTKYDLEGIAMRHLGVNMDLSAREEHLSACEQSDITMKLYKALSPVLEEKYLTALFNDVEMPLVGVLADMEDEGVGVDIKYLKERSDAMEKKLAETTDKIYKLAGEEFNINSPKQLQVILYDKLALPVMKKTKTGFSTDESVLRQLATLHELPKLLLGYREMNKLKTGYYDSILELADRKTHKLHANFNQAVTATGRLSSSEPNLQNIPIKTHLGKEIRRAFVPVGKGKLLLAADYSQVELRILAHLSNDKKLIDAFEKGEDVHRFTASLIFDCPLGDVTGAMRSVAKTVNFGIVYGMSSFGLAKDLCIGIEEAQNFIDAYFNRYDGVKTFIDRTITEARKTGFVTTLLKRRRYIPEITSSNERVKGFAERVAVNTPVQGSAADLIKLA
ncbi:DNA polymerase I, partial [Candidatus Omnitrophota bacterium]